MRDNYIKFLYCFWSNVFLFKEKECPPMKDTKVLDAPTGATRLCRDFMGDRFPRRLV